MDVGELLKIEREKKKMTQREFCRDIMTPSYYAKIEKGQHQVTVDRLMDLLDANEIKIDDFFHQLQATQSANHQFEIFSEQITRLFYEQDTEALLALKQTIDQQKSLPNFRKKFLISIIDSTIASLANDYSKMDSTSKEFLQNRLFDLSTWHIKGKLSLYSQILQFYDIDTNLMLLDSILKEKIESYSSLNQFNIIVALSNFVFLCIEQNRDDLAEKYVKLIDTQATGVENFFIKMMNHYHRLLLDVRANKIIDESELESIYKVLRLSGMELFSESLAEQFENQRER